MHKEQEEVQQKPTYIYQKPQGLMECMYYIKAIKPIFNIYWYCYQNLKKFSLKEEDIKAIQTNPNILLKDIIIRYLGGCEQEEVLFLLRPIKKEIQGVLRKKYISPLNEEIIEQVTLEDYLNMIQVMVDELSQWQLGHYFEGELGVLTYRVIDKAYERMKNYKKKDYHTPSRLEEMIFQAMKAQEEVQYGS